MSVFVLLAGKALSLAGVALTQQVEHINNLINASNIEGLRKRSPIMNPDITKYTAMGSALAIVAAEEDSSSVEVNKKVFMESFEYFSNHKIPDFDEILKELKNAASTSSKSSKTSKTSKTGKSEKPGKLEKLKKNKTTKKPKTTKIGGFDKNRESSLLSPVGQQVDYFVSSTKNKFDQLKNEPMTTEFVDNVFTPTFKTGGVILPEGYRFPWTKNLFEQLLAATKSSEFEKISNYFTSHIKKYLNTDAATLYEFSTSPYLFIKLSIKGGGCQLESTLSFESPGVQREIVSLFKNLSDCLDVIDSEIVKSKLSELREQLENLFARSPENIKNYYSEVESAAKQLSTPIPRVVSKRSIREKTKKLENLSVEIADLESGISDLMDIIGKSDPTSVEKIVRESKIHIKTLRQLETMYDSSAAILGELLSEWNNLISPNNVETCIMRVVKYMSVILADDYADKHDLDTNLKKNIEKLWK